MLRRNKIQETRLRYATDGQANKSQITNHNLFHLNVILFPNQKLETTNKKIRAANAALNLESSPKLYI
jgi:hypothetical protein